MYIPILKAKRGEFSAWKNLEPKRRQHCVPLFEFVDNDQTDTQELLQKYAASLAEASSAMDVVAVDLDNVREDTSTIQGIGAYQWIQNHLTARNVTVRPVIRIDDGEDVIEDAMAAVSDTEASAILRLDEDSVDFDSLNEASNLHEDLGQFLDMVSNITSSPRLHILVDLAAVEDGADAWEKTQRAQSVLNIVNQFHWASITLGAGAFPLSVSNLPKRTRNEVQRFDLQVWNQATKSLPNMAIDYCDYAVNHPSFPTEMRRGPLPSIRYTKGNNWIVRREDKIQQGPHPNMSFCMIVDSLISDNDFFGEAYSWGDSELFKRASKNSPSGSGGPTEWRAWATNHHLSVVIDHQTRSLAI